MQACCLHGGKCWIDAAASSLGPACSITSMARLLPDRLAMCCAPVTFMHLCRVCGVSREIHLVTRKKQENKKADWTHQRIWKDTSQTAYIAGLYLDNDRVLMSYGSSDIDARLLSMSVADVEGLFDEPFDCSQSVVLDNGSGQPMPLLGSSSATAEVLGSAVRHQQQVLPAGAAVNAALLRDVVKTAGTTVAAAYAHLGVPNGTAAATAAALHTGALPAGTVVRAEYQMHHLKHRRSQHHRDHRNSLR